jgi:hypothetical protein
LYYRPQTNEDGDYRINLEVVKPNERKSKIKEIYNDITKGLSKGLNAFYSAISKQYLGIYRKETSEFLKNQGDYQITRPIRKVINKPILSKIPNERWGIDEIKLVKYKDDNSQFQFILNLVEKYGREYLNHH